MPTGIDVTSPGDSEHLATRFASHRNHLRAVAYRMLGDLDASEDAVQETWIRLNRVNATTIENLGGWLTTVLSRICLDMLRVRSARRETPLDIHLPDPIVAADPEAQALHDEAVGLALLVVLEQLGPAERVVFVLHDLFALPFDEIAGIVDRSSAAARQLAMHARRRVREAPVPDADVARQHEVVRAFLAAARGGDFDALIGLLDPDVVLRVDDGRGGSLVRGARTVAGKAQLFGQPSAPSTRPVLVNGAAGLVSARGGEPLAVMACTVREGRIVEINLLADPVRLRQFVSPDLMS